MNDVFEQINEFVDSLLAGRRPRRCKLQDRTDAAALRMAARLAAERGGAEREPNPDFVARLLDDLAPKGPGEPSTALNRRGFLVAGLAGLAAGLGAGLGLGRWASQPPPPVPSPNVPIVRDNGSWFRVATLPELPQRATVRFTAGALEGHLVRRGDEVVALSALCSHMPCTLVWQEQQDHFLCPCHDATFHPNGEQKLARRSYPPLTRFQTRIEGDDVLIWSVGEDVPSRHASPL